MTEIEELIDACLKHGIDPYPIIVEELRQLGYEVREPNASEE